MGCDIHLVLEQRAPDGHWVGINDFQPLAIGAVLSAIPSEAMRKAGTDRVDCYLTWLVRDRSYRFFGELAGVRGEGPAHRGPNGFPDDASDLARMRSNEWGSDGHSHCHFLAPVFIERWLVSRGRQQEVVEAKLEGNYAVFQRTAVDLLGLRFLGHTSSVYKELEQFRVVCWFDN